MYYVTEYPYFKTTGISLFLHGALLVALLVLKPFAATQPPVITAVEIVSVTEPAAPESGAAVSEASPPPAPPAMAQPTPQTPPAQPLPPMVPDELSTTPTVQPVFAGVTAAASEPSAFAFAATGIPGGSGTVATATGSGSGTQVGTQGNGSGGRTRGSSVYAPKPRYPQAARRDGWEGNVLLRIRVETDGSVTVLSVLEGGRSDIEESAVETVSQWRYSPDRDENGEPVAASKSIRIKFNLHDEE
ncbi:transport protein TonB [Sporomusa ovata DSM 2662]|uniref:Ferric siderophore transport system, periplasmic binding protein TonB n=1 Tax=Sporomusa ovata TaxID=2378 RepID=A0A0U1L6Q1_9FIRM|nr:energy transducer TonB [Sporomusa ovata]EQB28488.1 TonB family transcriptional regulator [Sporomusa ovata DSM 2662]CQR74813.1 Ferric siderophore transport system, periplasmic binding protein TonB [Sporomusa ovata]